jgi:hypothetical protein
VRSPMARDVPAGKQPQLIDAMAIGDARQQRGRRPSSKQADDPCRAIEIVALTGQLYATDQLTPDDDCTRYSRSACWGRTNMVRATGTRAESMLRGRLAPQQPRRNDDADDDNCHRDHHPVLERDQTQHQELVDEPVGQRKSPR